MSVVFDEVLGSVPPRTEAQSAPTAPSPPASAPADTRRLASELARLRQRQLRVRAS